MTGISPNKADQVFLQIERLIVLQELPLGTLVSEKQLMELPLGSAVRRYGRRCSAWHASGSLRSLPIAACWCPQPRLRLNSNCSDRAGRWSRSPLPRGTTGQCTQRRTAAALAHDVLGATTSVDDFATFLRDDHALVV